MMMKTYARIEGGVVCELLSTAEEIAGLFHPDLIWLEVPEDQVDAVVAAHAYGRCVTAGASGWQIVEPAAPTAQQQIDANVLAIQAALDAQAKAKGYDNIVSACSYAAQPEGAPFQSEGAAFLAWRSAVWSQAYATLADVEAGTVPMPSPAEAVASMPALVLPVGP